MTAHFLHSLQQRKNTTLRAVHISLAVGVCLILIQLVAYFKTQSVAMLSSILESGTDVLATSIAWYSLIAAHRPPDREHRFGHGKAEPLAVLAQSAFIAGSAILLLITAINRFFIPEIVQAELWGMAAMILSSVLIIGLLVYQNKMLINTPSSAIHSDYVHYLGDLITNGGVLFSFLIIYLTDWQWVDPVCGALLALYLLRNAWRLGRSATNTLMDHELPQTDRDAIKTIIRQHSGVRGFHDLRTRDSGTQIFIEFHLELDGLMSLNAAHNITDSLEYEITRAYPNAAITIHQEPAGITDDRLDHIVSGKI